MQVDCPGCGAMKNLAVIAAFQGKRDDFGIIVAHCNDCGILEEGAEPEVVADVANALEEAFDETDK